jgi:alanine dehydrogenase
VKTLAALGITKALAMDPCLANGLNVHAGAMVHETVARDLGLAYRQYQILPADAA